MAGRVCRDRRARPTPGVTPEDARGARPGRPAGRTPRSRPASRPPPTRPKQISDAIGSFLTPVLLAFGGIAVLVGAFIIFNAFCITVAQRRREFAMLRALGASRRQVLRQHDRRGAHDGRARLGRRPLRRPRRRQGRQPGLQGRRRRHPAQRASCSQPRTILIAAAVGIVVTLLSALIPALRATRVPPVAALQEGAALPPSRFAQVHAGARRWRGRGRSAACSIAGGMYGAGGTTTACSPWPSAPCSLFVAVAMLSQVLRAAARRRARLAAAEARAHQRPPGPRQRRRNPSRTAARRRRS